MMSKFLRSEPGHDPVVVEAFFGVPVQRVFRAWTEPEEIKKWFGPRPNSLHSASVDLQKGGLWQFWESRDGERAVGFEGEYLDIQLDERLEFTWSKVVEHARGARETTSVSRVVVEFLTEEGGTRVRLVHSEIEPEEMRRGFAGGWGRGFGNLETLLVG